MFYAWMNLLTIGPDLMGLFDSHALFMDMFNRPQVYTQTKIPSRKCHVAPHARIWGSFRTKPGICGHARLPVWVARFVMASKKRNTREDGLSGVCGWEPVPEDSRVELIH